MRHIQTLTAICALATLLALAACSSSTTTDQLCLNHVPVTDVQAAGDTITFTATIAGGKTSTFAVPKTAFGGTPATLKVGDSVSFCANQVATGGHVTITLNPFVIDTPITATSTP